MKKIAAFACMFSLVTLYARADLSQLGWMTGCWSAVGRDAGSVEHWSSPAGGTMLGFSRVVGEGKTLAFEYLRIVDENDAIALIASPSGQETARFELREISENKVVFENQEHDFPQIISYRLDSAGNLNGRIEGTIDDIPNAADFPMTRISCDAGVKPLNTPD